MKGRGIACMIGSAIVGATAAVLYMNHKGRVKPMVEELLAKSMRLKDKAMDYASQAKDEVKDVVENAKTINANRES